MKQRIPIPVGILLLAVLLCRPFDRMDATRLRPVELIRVSRQGGWILVETDTGEAGTGTTLAAAFGDLKKTAPGTIFLDTAENLLLTPDCLLLLPELTEYLRPACGVCLTAGMPDMEKAAKFLSVHHPKRTLRDYRAGTRYLPVLLTGEGRMRLVQ